MINGPKLETRSEVPYVAIRTQVPMSELSQEVIPRLHSEVMEWLRAQGMGPSGAPFIRYRVIDMATKLDVEMGWPVAQKMQGNGRILADVLPAGRYGSLLYTGDYTGLMDANRVLIEWAQENGIAWDRWDSATGDTFASRFEVYITDPVEEPDPTKWETEVAIKVAE